MAVRKSHPEARIQKELRRLEELEAQRSATFRARRIGKYL